MPNFWHAPIYPKDFARVADLPYVELLEKSVLEFENDANASGRGIRALFDSQPNAFRAALPRLLKQPELSRGMRYLYAFMLGQNLLGEALSSPELTVEEAVDAARRALQVDVAADYQLARSLSPASSVPLDDTRTEKVLAVLAEVSDATRILPAVTLLNHPNPRIRSKVALFIGRGGRNPKWLQRAMEEPDPRVRANAVEALWGVKGDAALGVMKDATGDRNNRVAANALLALHSAGDASVLPQIVRMSLHPDPAFRASAAWVMGETGDPRFSVVLARLISEPSPMVRRRAFRSLSQLRKTLLRRQRQGDLTIAVGLPRTTTGGRLSVSVSIAAPPGGSVPRLLPTNFSVSEEGEPVFEYGVEPLIQPESLAVVMVLPRRRGGSTPPWLGGALACVSRKRPADSWWVMPFDEDVVESSESNLPPPLFTADAAIISEHLKTWNDEDAPGAWVALQRALLAPGPVRAARHLLILRLGENESRPAPPSLAADARSHRIAIHAVSAAPDPALARVCAETRGVFTLLDINGLPGAALERACLRMLPQYTLSWLPSHPPRRFQVQVGCEEGWGEDGSSWR